jgi:hypothetical protein
MSASMLLRECQQRGLNLWVDGQELRCRGKSQALTPEVSHLIRRYKTDLLILLTESSPHKAAFSPQVSPPKQRCGLGQGDDATSFISETSEDQRQTKTSDSPLSPHFPQELSRIGDGFHSGLPAPTEEDGNANTCVWGALPPDERGLGGLNERNPGSGHEVTPSPQAENAWTTRGLNPVACGLEPTYHPFFDAVIPTGALDTSRWSCRNVMCLDKSRGWWTSVHGVVNCRNCCPPQFPGLVAQQGGPDDAPLVDPVRSSTPT